MRTWGIHQIGRWVRVLRLGGAKRRFFLEAAKHSCGACEAQKRAAGPIVIVVGLVLFFLNTYEKHTLPAMNIVCWSTGLQRVIPLRDQPGETLRNAYRNNLLRSCGTPRILVVDPAAQLVLRPFSPTKLKAMGQDLK